MNTMQVAMVAMFKHAKGSMDTVELGELCCLTERASEEASRLSELCEGLGLLESGDEHDCSNLRNPESLCSLMLALSHSFDTIAAMVQVGDAATSELEKRTERPVILTKAKGGAA